MLCSLSVCVQKHMECIINVITFITKDSSLYVILVENKFNEVI